MTAEIQAVELIPTADWFYTSKGDPRGYIQPHTLKELWFHTGTACNLACPFCLEGSKPGDTRLSPLGLQDAQPYIDEALELGVEQFSFTGGEPFIFKEFVSILRYAAQHKPCLVLTNATAPSMHKQKTLQKLVGTPFPISFRVSIDYPNRELHDQGRGQGSFDKALEGIDKLAAMGFKVSVARQSSPGEDVAAVDKQYHDLLRERGIDENVSLVAFPDFLPPNSQADVPEITEHCMTSYQNEMDRKAYMCAFSKMMVKENGQMKIFSCTLVDDDPRYGVTGKLKDALEQKVMLAHHRCYSCFSCGASCSEM